MLYSDILFFVSPLPEVINSSTSRINSNSMYIGGVCYILFGHGQIPDG